MKAIYIEEKNKEKINNILEQVQKGARVRTVTFSDVQKACETINEKWQAPKKHMRHCIVDVSPHAQSFPNCYHGIPMTTIFRLEYKTKGWYLVAVKREKCGTIEYNTRYWTEGVMSAILNRHLRF